MRLHFPQEWDIGNLRYSRYQSAGNAHRWTGE
jgi:hypothetical protein